MRKIKIKREKATERIFTALLNQSLEKSRLNILNDDLEESVERLTNLTQYTFNLMAQHSPEILGYNDFQYLEDESSMDEIVLLASSDDIDIDQDLQKNH